MRKVLYSLIITFAFGSAWGQEGLKPLTANLSYYYPQPEHAPQIRHTTQQKGKAASLTLPFKEDFYYATYRKYPSERLWEQDSSVYVNTSFGITPPSIGVATFDGLNRYGYPYRPDLLNNLKSEPADTLTSKPIDLLHYGPAILNPNDSLALIFYYQARGYGEPPEATDSLVVDFYNPTTDKWKRAWFSRGNTNSNTNDTMFKRAFVPIDSSYLKDGFRFRFRNRATTNGDFDHWHVDYIYIDKDRRAKNDTAFVDVSIAHVPGSFLKDYSSMPYNQYKTNDMGLKTATRIRYNGPNEANFTYKFQAYKDNQPVFSQYLNNGNAKYFPKFGYYYTENPALSNPTIPFTFPDGMTDSTDYVIEHILALDPNAGTQFNYPNDTVLQYVRFRNYYSFDDGSAEAGYYVKGAGATIAQKITVNVADTFRAMRIYFDPSANVNSHPTFTIYIWEGPNTPGNVFYKASTADTVMYFKTSERGIPEYRLKNPIYLSPGIYFIGIKQGAADGLPIGFDRNYNRKTHLYYDEGSGWKQSAINGSLMMHPVFGKTIPPPVGISENIRGELKALVYPNPNNGNFLVVTNEHRSSAMECTLHNTMGQEVHRQTITSPAEEINATALAEGIYFLFLKENGKPVYQQKIIVQH